MLYEINRHSLFSAKHETIGWNRCEVDGLDDWANGLYSDGINALAILLSPLLAD